MFNDFLMFYITMHFQFQKMSNVPKKISICSLNAHFFKSRNSDLRHLIHYYFQTFICIIFHFCFRNLSQGSSDTGFFGSMEKDKKQRRQRSVFCEAFSRDFYCKKWTKKNLFWILGWMRANLMQKMSLMNSLKELT